MQASRHKLCIIASALPPSLCGNDTLALILCGVPVATLAIHGLPQPADNPPAYTSIPLKPTPRFTSTAAAAAAAAAAEPQDNQVKLLITTTGLFKGPRTMSLFILLLMSIQYYDVIDQHVLNGTHFLVHALCLFFIRQDPRPTTPPSQQQAAPTPLFAATYHHPLSIIITHTFSYTGLQTNAPLLSVINTLRHHIILGPHPNPC